MFTLLFVLFLAFVFASFSLIVIAWQSNTALHQTRIKHAQERIEILR